MTEQTKTPAELAAEKAVRDYKAAWDAARAADPTGANPDAYVEAARAAVPAYNEWVAAKRAEDA